MKVTKSFFLIIPLLIVSAYMLALEFGPNDARINLHIEKEGPAVIDVNSKGEDIVFDSKLSDKKTRGLAGHKTDEIVPDDEVVSKLIERDHHPFDNADIVAEYEDFLIRFNSPQGLTEDEIQMFFKQINDSIILSDEAKKIVADLYHSFGVEDVARTITTEALMNSEVGRGILRDEANAQLSRGDLSSHSEAFRVLANIDRDTVNYPAFEKAMYHIGNDISDSSVINAIGFIGESVERNKEKISPIHFTAIENTLVEAVLRRSDNKLIQASSAQKLYFITDRNKSAELASNFLLNTRNSDLVIETMYGIRQGYIAFGEELRTNLGLVLGRSSVSEKELAVARELFPQLLPAGS